MPRKIPKKPKTEPREQAAPSAKTLTVSARLRFWRWGIVAGIMLGLSLIMLFALWTSFLDLFGGLEHRMADLLIAYVSTHSDQHFDSREISLILIDKDKPGDAPPDTPFGKANSDHRRFHAKLINALAGKASVVVFDMEFRAPAQDPKADNELAAAIEHAEQSGTRILVGVELNSGDSEPTISAALKAALKDHWGTFVGRPSGTSSTYFVRLGSRSPNQPKPDFNTPDQQLIPSLALKAVEQLRYPDQNLQAFFDARTNIVKVRRDGVNGPILEAIPVDNKIYLAVQLVGRDEQGKRNRYCDVYAPQADLSEFKGKIVVVGYQVDDETKGSESERRYGAEIQANAISSMLRRSYISRLSTGYEYLIIVLMIMIGALLRLGFGKLANYKLPMKIPGGFIDQSVQIPVTLLVVALLYIFAAILAYKLERKVFNVPYSIVALFLSYLAIGAVRARLGFKVEAVSRCTYVSHQSNPYPQRETAFRPELDLASQ
jgi:CHASE2 domain-containing sensor protein